jgi:hypothetical protein
MLRKTPIKFTFNNTKYNVPVNDMVPACGYVNVLTDERYTAQLVNGDAIKIYVECNLQSRQNGRIYALYYNINTKQFDGNFTIN